MKKLLPLFLVVMVVAFVAPSLAEVVPVVSYVNAQDTFSNTDVIAKYKTTYETKTITDTYTTHIDVWFTPDSRAMAEVVKKQINEDNSFNVYDVDYKDEIKDSFYMFKGIGQANQAAGSMNNQGNVVSAAVTDKAAAWANAEVLEFQLNDRGNVFASDSGTDPYADKIDSSFNKFSGVGQANQAAGFCNNQNNVVAIAFSTNGAKVAEADVTLDQVNVGNYVSDRYVCRTNTVCNSFNNFQGIGQANQSSGNFNNQSNIVAFAGTK